MVLCFNQIWFDSHLSLDGKNLKHYFKYYFNNYVNNHFNNSVLTLISEGLNALSIPFREWQHEAILDFETDIRIARA